MKKFLILFLVLSLCISCFSITVFATDGEEETDTRNILEILRDAFKNSGPVQFIKEKVSAIWTILSDSLESWIDNVESAVSNLRTNISTLLTSVKDNLTTLKNDFANKFPQLYDKLSNFKDNFDSYLSDVTDWFSVLNDNLKAKLDSVSSGLSGLRRDISYLFNNIGDKIKSAFGVPTDIEPDTSIGNELDSETEEIIGNAEGAYDFVEQAFDKLLEWGAGFLVVGYFINSLTQISFLNYLVNFSLALGLLALSLNLFGSILTASKGNKPNGAKGGKTP